jgi:aldehyde:ferredoxin oxidoreductase
MLALLEKIAKREGDVPRILGEGVRIAAQKLGVEDPLHVNGAVVPAHDPRAFLSMAVATATSMKGASHLHGFPEAIELGVTFPEAGLMEPLDPHSPAQKGLAAVKFQDRMGVCNSAVVCFFYEFSGLTFSRLTDFLNAITGWTSTPQDLLKTGERIINVMNMFNIKHGLNPARDYRLPKRFLMPHKTGGAANVPVPFDAMIEEYYSVRDWPKGLPSSKKLRELGLEFCL